MGDPQKPLPAEGLGYRQSMKPVPVRDEVVLLPPSQLLKIIANTKHGVGGEGYAWYILRCAPP